MLKVKILQRLCGWQRSRIRLFIAASPKTGNVWLERLLAEIYNLPVVDLSGIGQAAFSRISRTKFVTHQHYIPTPELLEWGEKDGVRFLTMVRHPGAVFVSLYHYVNNFASLWEKKGWIGTSPAHVMIDEDINSSKVLEFLRTKFRSAILGKSLLWLQSGKSLVVRYENLYKAPVETLKQLTEQIKPVEPAHIEQAIEACHIDKMRTGSDMMQMHCRKGKIDNWQEELSEEHIDIFRKYYTQELILLGYNLVS